MAIPDNTPGLLPQADDSLTHNDIAIADDEHLTVGDVGLQDLAKIVAVGIGAYMATLTSKHADQLGRYEAKKTEKAEHAPVDQTGLAACFELLDL